jgi:transcriptional regulator with GAF, ATPase, and Fis domain
MDETVQSPMGRVDDERPAGARLVVVFPSTVRAVVPLGEGELVMGRKPGDRGHLVDDPTVSRRHFAVRWDEAGSHHVGLDLGSRNGSRIEGRRQPFDEAPRPLDDGDVIRLGDVLMIYERGSAVGAEDNKAVQREMVPGSAARTVQLRAAIAAAAPDPSPVLLVGETGTGKEFVAREVHRLSGRKGPLIPVNCAALSPQLVESQLFGHKKGAFTGAQSDHEGFFRAADGGTLFLDEIGELPRELQPKLLRVLQEGEVQAVGETKPIAVDVRVISATLRELDAMIEEGAFRLDLYARLSPFEIEVPALRERRADILDWAERLYRAWHAKRERSITGPLGLDADAAERLLLNDWLDNLRGLDRLVHRLCSEPGSAVDARVLLSTGSGIQLPKRSEGAGESEGPVEATPAEPTDEPSKRPKPTKEELIAVLEEHEGSVRATAKYYGRDRRQIYRWLDQYGLREQR